MVENGETIEVTDRHKVIARLVPANPSEPIQTQAKNTQAFWADLDQLAVQIGSHWQDNMSAVDAVRDVRREL